MAVKPYVEAGCGLVAERHLQSPAWRWRFNNFPSEGFYFNVTTDNFDVGGSTVFVIWPWSSTRSVREVLPV